MTEESATTRLQLRSSVQCKDRDFGELADVVVDPTDNRITHLVVKQHGFGANSWLVPIVHVESARRSEPIALDLRAEEVREFEYVTEYASFGLTGDNLPKVDRGWGIGIETVIAMPSDQTGMLGDGELMPGAGMQYDRIPAGEVEIRHSSPIRSTDGDYVGDTGGFLVDARGKISEIVIERGHLWRRREVTIPISVVSQVETDAVTLSLSKADVASLPSVRRARRWW